LTDYVIRRTARTTRANPVSLSAGRRARPGTPRDHPPDRADHDPAAGWRAPAYRRACIRLYAHWRREV